MKSLILGVALTDDPVEIHIIKYLDKLVKQNKRLKSHIEKTGEWVPDKNIQDWKPFDFYNYFRLLYRNKYMTEFPGSGDLVRQYSRIEAFMKTNKVSNEDFKKFMDSAFARRFNSVNKPTIGAITSKTLYKFIMQRNVRNTTPQDLIKLDCVLEKEQEESQDLWKEKGIASGMTVGDVLERMNDPVQD